MSIRPFYEQGHYTGVHDAVFDKIMPITPPNAFKILMFVLRKTEGWGKEQEKLSYEAIKKGTGISSQETVSNALKWLVKEGMINKTLTRRQDGTSGVSVYSLNRDYELELQTSKIEHSPSSKIEHVNKQLLSSSKKQREEGPVAEATDLLLATKGWQLSENATRNKVRTAVESYPWVDVPAVARDFKFKVDTGAVSYKLLPKAFVNWVTRVSKDVKQQKSKPMKERHIREVEFE